MASEDRYIVLGNDWPRPAMLGHYGDTPRGGVLMFGDYGHLFRSRRAAKRALERTIEYARRNRLPWDAEQYRIERLRYAAQTPTKNG